MASHAHDTAGEGLQYGREEGVTRPAARALPSWRLCRDTIFCIMTGGSLAGECVTIQLLYRDRSEGLTGSEGHDTINCIVIGEDLAVGECVTIQSVVS